MSVTITPHRGDATTRALVAAAIGDVAVDQSTGDLTITVGEESDARVVTSARARTVGFSSAADYWPRDVLTTASGTSFVVAGRPVNLALVGERHIVGALAAIAAAVELGVDIDTAIGRVETVTASPGDFATREVDGVLFIDDTSDAGSRSTVEALKSIAEIAGESRRTVAVLGELHLPSADPLEKRDEHDRLGRIVVRLNIGQLVVVGAGARHLSTAAGLEGSWDGESVLVGSTAEAYDLLRADIREGDIVLVKVPELLNRLIEARS